MPILRAIDETALDAQSNSTAGIRRVRLGFIHENSQSNVCETDGGKKRKKQTGKVKKAKDAKKEQKKMKKAMKRKHVMDENEKLRIEDASVRRKDRRVGGHTVMRPAGQPYKLSGYKPRKIDFTGEE